MWAVTSASVYYVLLCFVNSGVNAGLGMKKDPEIHMNTSEIVVRWGYVPEVHETVTADGYHLKLVRVLPKKVKHYHPNRIPIFFMHGLECSSTDWVMNPAPLSAGFYFPERGFDVWLGNNRGNRYCRKHDIYPEDSEEFWDWSWEDMAKYDLPALVDKVLEVTKKEQVYYVGHSQGTLLFLVKASEDQDFAKKIRMSFLLGPVYTMGHMGGLFKLGAKAFSYDVTRKLVGKKIFTPDNAPIYKISRNFCPNRLTYKMCASFILKNGGGDTGHLNKTRLGVIMAHYPSGTSAKNIFHFLQMMRSGKCERFDYGDAEVNIQHYGQPTPPECDLTNYKVTTVLFWSDKDTMSPVKDIENYLIPNIARVVIRKKLDNFNHADYTWGTGAAEHVYKEIVRHIKKNLHEKDSD